MKVLVVDNYDSFVYNLVQYVGELGTTPMVFRNNAITIEQAIELSPDRIIISPGPGSVEQVRYFGICSDVIQKMSPEIPTLGVCLGHQGIIHGFGGKIVRAKNMMHGKTSLIKHDGKGLFKGIENPLEATRYHSLVGDRTTIPSCLEISATSMDDGEVMAVRHVEYPIEGVQFHPESILTNPGKQMLKNFLRRR
ncbi:MAG: anthranilate synthase component II [Candidatus Ranarchaeia archaeon]|jgi:anthranilate synthase component 2